MARESADDKAVRLFAEYRITVLKATEDGIALAVRGDTGTYRVLRYARDGQVVESCTCPSPTRECSHIKAARRLWTKEEA
jgi:hypothetical protein